MCFFWGGGVYEGIISCIGTIRATIAYHMCVGAQGLEQPCQFGSRAHKGRKSWSLFLWAPRYLY